MHDQRNELAYLAVKAELSEKLAIEIARETGRTIWSAEKKNLPMAAKVVDTIDTRAPTIELYREFAKYYLAARTSTYRTSVHFKVLSPSNRITVGSIPCHARPAGE